MNKIEICTHLHSGIYASHGGDNALVHYAATVGPLNLLRLSNRLEDHIDQMRIIYGNGISRSWLQINGQAIDIDDLPESMVAARDLLADVASGAYASRLAIRDAYDAEWHRQYQAGLDAEWQPQISITKRGT